MPGTKQPVGVAMVTAAAHRCGKQLVRDLAADGYDLGSYTMRDSGEVDRVG